VHENLLSLVTDRNVTNCPGHSEASSLANVALSWIVPVWESGTSSS